jgi:hypothetical protein
VVVALGGEERALEQRRRPRVGEEVAPDPGVPRNALRERPHRVRVVEVALQRKTSGRASARRSNAGPNWAAQEPMATVTGAGDPARGGTRKDRTGPMLSLRRRRIRARQ